MEWVSGLGVVEQNTLKSFRIYRPSSIFMCRERTVSIWTEEVFLVEACEINATV